MVVVGDLAVLKATFNYVCACRRTSEPWREGREGREPRVGAAPPVECGPSSDARGADPNRSTLHNPMGGGSLALLPRSPPRWRPSGRWRKTSLPPPPTGDNSHGDKMAARRPAVVPQARQGPWRFSPAVPRNRTPYRCPWPQARLGALQGRPQGGSQNRKKKKN